MKTATAFRFGLGALSLCALVLASHLAFGPVSAAQSCSCGCYRAGTCYDPGTCLGGYQCDCVYGGCSGCSWARTGCVPGKSKPENGAATQKPALRPT